MDAKSSATAFNTEFSARDNEERMLKNYSLTIFEVEN